MGHRARAPVTLFDANIAKVTAPDSLVAAVRKEIRKTAKLYHLLDEE